ncbi:MAG: pirin family protein [Alphaproteobacteria bacterium]|nr:pirin family protein [Alphaproteobacteria bacterium]
MITIRPSEERGPADFGWLKARHSFSFGNYYDPRHMGFRNLRVINEDRVAAGAGFPTHGHRDMEIVTYLLDGELEHKDSMGNGEVIRPGEVQAMSAGTGVLHSEFNPSDANPTHLLQIWLLPDKQGHTPRYDQKVFSRDEKLNKLRLVVSPDGADDSIFIHQDSKIYASILEAGKTVALDLAPKRHAWVQVARGEVALGENVLKAGDGAAISDLAKLEIKGIADASEFLVFDLN